MTQEEAENMSNEQAVKVLTPYRDAMRDRNGCPTSEAYFALDMAIKALESRSPGRWVSVGCVVPNIANVPMIKCTVCGHLEPDVDAARTPYCSHCGAYMGGDN